MLLKLKAQIIANGWALKGFAAELGVTPVYLSYVISGKRVPSPDFQVAAAHLLDCTEEDLFDDVDRYNRPE